jgi:NTP pyrophosphatase (non-canonical NTP hydrolase)
MNDLTTPDATLTSLLRHLPREVRSLIVAVDELRGGWEMADSEARHKLWSAVDDAREAVQPTIAPDLKRVLDDVAAERMRQDEKWGVQDIHDYERISILTEEVGEAAKAANEANFTTSPTRGDRTHLRKELIQVAAVAVDYVQAIDRRPTSEADRA